MIEIELPFPPSVNHYWRMWRGRIVISEEGRAYRVRVAVILRARGIKPVTGPLAVEIEVFPPDRRRRDLDNLLKSLNDSLQHGGAFPDDSQIVWLLIERAPVVPGGKVIVRISERGEGAAPVMALLPEYPRLPPLAAHATTIPMQGVTTWAT